ncbi:MAG: hypothetical protein HYT03_01695 [Candidatus Harrisonbacteria bacterium]|nr:hypothetical protein [Candidatus Harrisonbacteria bacterium]
MRSGFALLFLAMFLVSCVAASDMSQTLIGFDQDRKPIDFQKPEFDHPIFFTPKNPTEKSELYEQPIMPEPKRSEPPTKDYIERVPHFHQRPHQ